VRLLCLLLILGLFSTSWAEEAVRELTWDDLIPEGYMPEELLAQLDTSKLADDDPETMRIYEELRKKWAESPADEQLDGQLIKLPGFVVPLDGGPKAVSEFLMVPFFGGCIHVPPPPANQTVLVDVLDEKGTAYEMFETVWVTGIIKVERIEEELGTAGYRIDAQKIEPYE
jgi:hypothetical protein